MIEFDALSHDPYAHDPAAATWGISKFSNDGNGQSVEIAEWPNGDLWIGDDKQDPTEDKVYLAFRRDERLAVLLSVIVGDDPAYQLTEEERAAVLAAVEARNPGLILSH